MLLASLRNVAGLKSVSYDGSVNLAATYEAPQLQFLQLPAEGVSPESILPKREQAVINLNFKGAADNLDPVLPKSRFEGEVNFESPQGILGGSGEVMVRGKKLYFRLLNLTGMGEAFKVLTNKWAAVDLGEVPQENEVDPEKTRALRALFSRSRFVSVTKTFSVENMNGIEAYHYELTFNKEGLKNFYIEASEVVSEETMSAEQRQMLDDIYTNFEFQPAEIWIDKKEKLPLRLRMGLNFNETGVGAYGGKFTGSFTAEFNFKDFNLPLNLTAPAEARPAKEVFKEFINLYLTSKLMQISSSTASSTH